LKEKDRMTLGQEMLMEKEETLDLASESVKRFTVGMEDGNFYPSATRAWISVYKEDACSIITVLRTQHTVRESIFQRQYNSTTILAPINRVEKLPSTKSHRQ